MQQNNLCLLFLGLLLSLSPQVSLATVIPVRFYRFGDMDSSFTHGSVVTTVLDYVTASHLTSSGSPTYSNDSAAFPLYLSKLALDIAETQYASSPVVLSLPENGTNDFGLELWVKPRGTTGSRCLAYNGTPGTNGWGLYLVNNSYQARLGGVTVLGDTPAAVNEWTHLALVRASGNATFYVNGLPAATSTQAPLVPVGQFALGAAPPLHTSDCFDGLLDEVRVFRFNAGEFGREDLRGSRATVPPHILSNSGAAVDFHWPQTEVDFVPQASGDLTPLSWSGLPVEHAYDFFRASESSVDPRRFYRLVSRPSSLDIIEPRAWIRNHAPGGLGELLAPVLVPEVSVPQSHLFAARLFSLSKPLILDVSRSINPRTGSTSDLTYHWHIRYDDPEIPDPYLHPGIAGFDSAVLRIGANSLVPTSGGNVTISVDITDSQGGQPERSMRCEFPGAVTN